MADLVQINPRANPYFQNRRIRRFLVRHGLINRHGDILPPVTRSRDTIDQNGDAERKRMYRSTFRSPGRAKSANQASWDLRNRSKPRSAKAKVPETTLCRVIMTYIGPQAAIEYDKSWFQHEGDEIVVMQQHCGGENLTVFKGFVKPQETFAFDSRRHSDYPFALALYINGLIDCRVSVCCEYKHKKNVPLGGPSGSFSISDVQKVKPCRSCRFERLKKKPSSAKPLATNDARYRKSIVPRKLSRSPTPPPTRPPQDSPETDDKSPFPESTQKPVSTTASVRSLLVSRKAPPSPEADEKKQTAHSEKHGSSNPQKAYNPTQRSLSVSSSDDEEVKNPERPPSVTRIKPVIPTRRSSSSESSDESIKFSSAHEADDKRPQVSSAKSHPPAISTGHSARKGSPDLSRTPTPTLDSDDRRPQISSGKPHSSAVPTGYSAHKRSPDSSATSTSDADDKRPQISSAKPHSSAVPTGYSAHKTNPDLSRTSTPDADDKRPQISSAKPHSSAVSTGYSAHKIDPDLSRASTPDADDKRPQISSGKPHSSAVSTGYSTHKTDPDLSRTPTPDVDDKRPRISSAKPRSSAASKPVTSVARSPVISQKNGNGTENYEFDFDESNDDDGRQPTSSRYGQPRISDASSNDDALYGKKNQLKHPSKSPRSSDSIDDQIKRKSPTTFNGQTTITDDAGSTSDKPKIEHTRRVSSSSSEDFFGVKRSSTKENSKPTPGLASDWFETTSRNDPDENDPPPPKTKSWERILFSDDEK